MVLSSDDGDTNCFRHYLFAIYYRLFRQRPAVCGNGETTVTA